MSHQQCYTDTSIQVFSDRSLLPNIGLFCKRGEKKSPTIRHTQKLHFRGIFGLSFCHVYVSFARRKSHPTGSAMRHALELYVYKYLRAHISLRARGCMVLLCDIKVSFATHKSHHTVQNTWGLRIRGCIDPFYDV